MASVIEQSTSPIPVLDAEALAVSGKPESAVLDALRTAFGEFGILHVAGHGLSEADLDALYATYSRFCAQDDAAKQEVSRPDLWFQRGWTPPNTERAVAAGGQPDFKECYFAACTEIAEEDRVLFPEINAANVWPSAGFDEFEERYARVALALQALGERILGGCEHALGLRAGAITDPMRGGPHVTRLLRYLPLGEDDYEDGVPKHLWGENHTDFCTLTLLPGGRFLDPDGERTDAPRDGSGLFLTSRSGALVPGTPPAGCLTVQVGQQLETLTGGALLATPHQIRAPRTPGISRLSCAHFMHLHTESKVFPLEGLRTPESVARYRPPVLAGTYDVKILVDIGLAPAGALERFSYKNQGRIASQTAER